MLRKAIELVAQGLEEREVAELTGLPPFFFKQPLFKVEVERLRGKQSVHPPEKDES